MEENNLARDYNVRSLLAFTAPTCIMWAFMALYELVDGVFVSNYVGETALAALNVSFPFNSIILGISVMLATGGSAIIARNMGEGKDREAKENFSLLLLVGILIGIVFAVAGAVWIDPIVRLLGATDVLAPYCHDYLLVLILAAPMQILQQLFQMYFVTAGKPNLGLALTVMAGVGNIFMDYFFLGVLGMGVAGAGLGTAIGYSIPAVIGLLYFAFQRKGTLYIVRPRFRGKMLLQACANGSSEMVTNLALAVVTFMFNMTTLKYLGENGVAAIAIILDEQFLLTAFFMGFSDGTAPIFSYNYGNGNHQRTKKLFKMCMGIVTVFSIVMFLISIVFAKPIIACFTPRDSEAFAVTYYGSLIFSVGYLFTGFNIFASGLFTAFSNGVVSALLSFLRTFGFLVAALVFLPMVLDIAGIWLAIPVAEFLTVLFSFFFLYRKRTEYHY